MRRLLGLLLALSMLVSCAPRASYEPAEGRLFYRTTSAGDLLLTTVPLKAPEGVEHPPLVQGFADIRGPELVLQQGPWCVDACAPNVYGFIGLRFEPGDRGSRIVIPVVAGEPVAGVASFDVGIGVNLDAEFTPPKKTPARR